MTTAKITSPPSLLLDPTMAILGAIGLVAAVLLLTIALSQN